MREWKLEDPKGKPIEMVREIRDEIEMLVKKLIGDRVERMHELTEQ